MRREDFTTNVDTDDRTPQLTVTFEGTDRQLRDRLEDEGEPLSAEDLDVTYRQTPGDDPGVLAVTDRLTGAFVFEAEVPHTDLRTLIETTAEREEGDRHYELRVEPGEEAVTFRKETLLVYDAAGNLDREHSLIPGGVEL